MPTIPVETLDQTLPSRTGLPRAIQDAPFIPNAPGNLGASQVVGNAVAGLGTSVLQANELKQQRDAIEERKRAADDVIASKLSSLGQIPAIDVAFQEEKANPDYTTFDTRFLARGKALIAEGGTGLSPRARQLYQEHLESRLVSLHQHALTDKAGRQQEATAYTLAQAFREAETTIATAQNRYDVAQARGNRDKYARALVDTGLVHGVQMEAQVRQSDLRIATGAMERAIIARPDDTLDHLLALNRNQAGDPTLPPVPQEVLPDLIAKARQAVDHTRQRAEHEEKYGLWRADQDGQAKTMWYRSEISKLDPTPANAQRFRQLIEMANSAEQQQILGPRGHQEVTSLLRGTLNMALSATTPNAVDDPLVEQDMNLRIMTAKTPAQLYAVEEFFIEQGYKGLTPETGRTIHGLILQRLDQSSHVRHAEYQAGIDVIARAEIIPPSSGPGDTRKLKVEKAVLNALDQYDRDYRQVLNEHGVGQAKRQAIPLAEAARLAFIPPTADTLPLLVRNATSIAEMRARLDQLQKQGVGYNVLKEYDTIWRKEFDAKKLPWQVQAPAATWTGTSGTTKPVAPDPITSTPPSRPPAQ